MQKHRPVQFLADVQCVQVGGVIVRTGLRAGTCVDVNDQVKTALQTLTNALSGTATAVPVPITSDNTTLA